MQEKENGEGGGGLTWKFAIIPRRQNRIDAVNLYTLVLSTVISNRKKILYSRASSVY
jgi:hypothetical protein